MISPLVAAGVSALGNVAANAVGDRIGQMFDAGAGNAQGRVATAGANSNKVQQTYDQLRQQLTPEEQGQLANQMAGQANTMNQGASAQQEARTFQMANEARNLNTQRDMMVNAQTNAANNVANQLSALQNARNTNAQLLANAATTTAGMFR